LSIEATAIPEPIGVFGGTFDPVHFGHLRAALEIYEELQPAEVRLIPCRVPAHRASPSVSGDHRLALLRLAVEGVPGLCVDDRELRRPGPSYMVDTLASLREERPEAPLWLIVGMDSFLGLPGWHRWLALFELAHVVVMSRPGYAPTPPPALAEQVERRRVAEPEPLRRTPAGAVYFHAVTPLDISATRIRALIAAGRAPRFLLPETVWQRIAQQGWYGWNKG